MKITTMKQDNYIFLRNLFQEIITSIWIYESTPFLKTSHCM